MSTLLKKTVADEDIVAPEPSAFGEVEYASIYPEGIENHYWWKARHRMFHRHLKSVLAKGARRTPLLDVGCGPGMFVDYLNRRGFDAFGCDLGTPRPLNPDVSSRLFLGRDAFELDSAISRRIEVLTLLDVLEHLPRPGEFLRNCVEHFPRCRHVLISLPACQSLWSNHDEFNGHYLRYDLTKTRQLASAARCDVLFLGYCFHLLYLPARLMALCGIRRNTRIRAPGGAMKLAHRILAVAFEREQALMPRTLLGSSVLALLRTGNK